MSPSQSWVGVNLLCSFRWQVMEYQPMRQEGGLHRGPILKTGHEREGALHCPSSSWILSCEHVMLEAYCSQLATEGTGKRYLHAVMKAEQRDENFILCDVLSLWFNDPGSHPLSRPLLMEEFLLSFPPGCSVTRRQHYHSWYLIQPTVNESTDGFLELSTSRLRI